jgi:cellulose synthase/poly-beta-1,6-N-acetylglucosamine synthase-like glycosyltransferase
MKLPSLAVLIPIYKEKERLLKQNYEIFSKLNYSGKLQVYWLLHKSDGKTIINAQKINTEFQMIIDDSNPPLKANALNNALKYVNEEIVTVFDVDSIISSDYLRKGVSLLLKFKDKGVVLTQGIRSFYNANVNWLTRSQQLGTGAREYHEKAACLHLDKPCWWYVLGRKKGVMDECNIGNWFYVSGTGYFIPKKVLEEVGGWSQTITEDIDLGTKLYRRGRRMLVFSYPMQYEECPETTINFLRQQARWRKGWVKHGMDYDLKVNFPQIWTLFLEIRHSVIIHSLTFLSFILGFASLLVIIRLPLWIALFLGGTVLYVLSALFLHVVILPYFAESPHRPDTPKTYGLIRMGHWILWGLLSLKGWLELKIGYKPLAWYRTKKRGCRNLIAFLRRILQK